MESHFYGGSSLLIVHQITIDLRLPHLTMVMVILRWDFGVIWMVILTLQDMLLVLEDGGNQTFYLGTGGANGYWGSFGVKIGGTQYEVNGDATKGRIRKWMAPHRRRRDGTNIKLFVDGNLIGTTACTSGSMISLPTYVYVENIIVPLDMSGR